MKNLNQSFSKAQFCRESMRICFTWKEPEEFKVDTPDHTLAGTHARVHEKFPKLNSDHLA